MTPFRVMALALVSGAAAASTGEKEASLQVCMGADQVLRHQADGVCPSGTTSYELSLAANDPGLPPKQEEKAWEQRMQELRLRNDMLLNKLMDVQKELAKAAELNPGLKVQAPFTVVDKAGKMIFRVQEVPGRGFEMATASGKSVAFGSALETGGFFKTRSPTVYPEVVMGTSGNLGGFIIRDDDQLARASLTLTNGKPSLELNNENHVGIVAITQGPSGGGHVQLGDATGTSMVQAGITAGNCGKVETFPFRPPGAVVGVAGSWIMGKGC